MLQAESKKGRDLFFCRPSMWAREGEAMTNSKNINQARVALRAVFGLVPLLAGLDKFLNLLTNWREYLSPFAKRMLPVKDTTFMHAVGVIEMLVGLSILTRWPRQGAYVASAWLLLIAINLLTTGSHFDVATRDVALAVCAFALARLTEADALSGATRAAA
jgi:uncharacterized membrane protein YphA (DoxX/SURF4 family)